MAGAAAAARCGAGLAGAREGATSGAASRTGACVRSLEARSGVRLSVCAEWRSCAGFTAACDGSPGRDGATSGEASRTGACPGAGCSVDARSCVVRSCVVRFGSASRRPVAASPGRAPRSSVAAFPGRAPRFSISPGRLVAATAGCPWFTLAESDLSAAAACSCCVCSAVGGVWCARPAASSAAVGRAWVPPLPPLKLTRLREAFSTGLL